jgi:hypothetical protein
MNITNLALLNSKHMAIGRAFIVPSAIQARKTHEDIHHTHNLIDDVSPVGHGNVFRKTANIACVGGQIPATGVTSLQRSA